MYGLMDGEVNGLREGWKRQSGEKKAERESN